MPYTFGTAGPYNFTSDGKTLANSHMFYWSNFANNSNPNPSEPSSLFKIWPTYNLNSRKFLRFVAPENKIENSYLKSECDFFDKIGFYN